MVMVLMMAVVVVAMTMLAVVVAKMAAERAETRTVTKMLRMVADRARNDDEANAALEMMAAALQVA